MLFLLFTLDGERYVVDATRIERVMALSAGLAPKPVLGAPSWIVGVIEHGGLPVPVIDLPALALGRPAARVMSTRLVLVRCTHDGDTHLLGLLLEGVSRTVRVDVEAFRDGGVMASHARYLGPVASDAQGFIQRIDVDGLLSDGVRALLFGEAPA